MSLEDTQDDSIWDEGEAELIRQIQSNPEKKLALMDQLGIGDDERDRSLSGKDSGRTRRPPTPSGTIMGGYWQQQPPPFWWPRGPGYYPPFSGQPTHAQSWDGASCSSDISNPGPRKRQREVEEGEPQDSIELLGDAEALQLIEFDPAVDPKDSWQPPKAMASFLTKHFNKSLSEEEREAILKDFPVPNCGALKIPKLDDQVKDHIKSKGKDPHFGSEKSLYKLQDTLLDVAGPLTCLWADLLNEETSPSREDVLLLTQRALVLLGSASHLISLERRKVAWAKINPKLRSLATEEYDKRESNLFGPGFLEKASKRIEVDKTMSKVSNPHSSGANNSNKRARYSRDKTDLRSFLARGPPARYGDKRAQRPQPY